MTSLAMTVDGARCRWVHGFTTVPCPEQQRLRPDYMAEQIPDRAHSAAYGQGLDVGEGGFNPANIGLSMGVSKTVLRIDRFRSCVELF